MDTKKTYRAVLSLGMMFMLIAASSLFTRTAAADHDTFMRLSAEQREAAWALESKAVTDELKLDPMASAKVAEAYSTARRSHYDQMSVITKSHPTDHVAIFKSRVELRAKEKANLRTSLTGMMDEDQLNRAMALLGSFNPQWDVMTATLADFKMEDPDLSMAMRGINTYVQTAEGEYGKVRDKVGDKDADANSPVVQQARITLDKSMAEILSADQLATWKQRTMVRHDIRQTNTNPKAGKDVESVD